MSTRMARILRISGVIVLIVVCLSVMIGRLSFTQTAHAQPAWPDNYFAPYSFAPSNQDDLVALSQKTGTKYFTLAFIINQKGKTCQASWNSIQPVGSWMQDRIHTLQKFGGGVSVSFGGAAGTELADSCTTVKALEAQYQSLITTYNLTQLDFDIEGKTLANTAGNELRNKAIAALQADARAAGRKLVISYTLPVNVTGLPKSAVNLLQNAIQNGVEVGVVNIMTMDYYNKNAPGNKMARNTIRSAQSLFTQLHSLYPSKNSSQLWALVGLTPMIGVNDDPKEIFTLQDAQTVVQFAGQQHIALLSFWEVQRDHQCVNGQKPPNNCTGVQQQPYQYDQIFASF